MDKNYSANAPPPPYPGVPPQTGFNTQGDPYVQQAPPMAGYPQPTVYVQQPPVNVHVMPMGRRGIGVVSVAGTFFGSHPVNITCSNCGAQVVTKTETRPGLKTWLLCGMLLLVGCFAGCCLIPFCFPECQDVEHSCPNCKTYLGSNRVL